MLYIIAVKHHPKQEVPGLTCLGRESNPGLHGEEPFKKLVNSCSEHLLMSAQPVENAHGMAPPSACVA